MILSKKKKRKILTQFMFIAKIYPRGFAGSMREFSDKFHQINCWDDHPDDYQDIFLEFLTFIKVNIIIIRL